MRLDVGIGALERLLLLRLLLRKAFTDSRDGLLLNLFLAAALDSLEALLLRQL